MGELLKFNESKRFEIRNKTETTAEIVIYTEIGSSFWFDALSAKDFDKELKALPKTVNQLDVRINSPGGDVFDGVTIYNRLKQFDANITVYVDGLAASIASIIAMAGDEIIMGTGALMMIHKPWTWTAGDSNELQSTIDRLDDIEEQLITIYQRKTKLDRAEIRKMLSDETWMDADQAIEMGFATEQSELDDQPDIAACFKNAKWINKIPNVEQKNAHKEEISSFKKRIEDMLARNK